MSLVIERTLELKASQERVWKAITDEEELGKWFPDRAEMPSEAGQRGSLSWDEHGSFEVEVVEIQPMTRFVWRWAGGGERPLDDYATTVEWTLTSRTDGGTTVLVRESGFDTQDNFNENSNGWDEELKELVELVGGLAA